MTDEEKIVALTRHIVGSSDANDRCKKVVLWLLEKSDSLTKAVWTIVDAPLKDFQDVWEIIGGIHDMNSSNGQTRLPALCDRLGLNFKILSSGNRGEGKILIRPDRELYKYSDAQYVKYDQAVIEAIVLDDYR